MSKQSKRGLLGALWAVAAIAVIARIGAGCGGGGAPIRDQVNDELKRIINECRGGEMNQLPSKAGTGVVCDGVSLVISTRSPPASIFSTSSITP